MTSIRVRALVVVGAALLAGCVDATGDFDSFAHRTDSLDLSMAAPDLPPGQLLDISGQFLLALAVSSAPDQPLQFLTTSKLTMNGDGTGSLDTSFQPLSVTSRAPVGSPLVANGTPVTSDGTFVVVVNQGMVLAAANPITGSDIVFDVQLHGAIRSVNRFCGPVTGMLVQPVTVDVGGSAFGAVRVADPKMLPAPDSTCPAATDGGT